MEQITEAAFTQWLRVNTLDSDFLSESLTARVSSFVLHSCAHCGRHFPQPIKFLHRRSFLGLEHAYRGRRIAILLLAPPHRGGSSIHSRRTSISAKFVMIAVFSDIMTVSVLWAPSIGSCVDPRTKFALFTTCCDPNATEFPSAQFGNP